MTELKVNTKWPMLKTIYIIIEVKTNKKWPVLKTKNIMVKFKAKWPIF